METDKYEKGCECKRKCKHHKCHKHKKCYTGPT